MEITIDGDKLREDLLNYFGSATPMIPMAMGDVLRIQSADAQELADIAIQNGFDIFEYQV